MQEQRGQVPEEGDVEREQAYQIAQVRGVYSLVGSLNGWPSFVGLCYLATVSSY